MALRSIDQLTAIEYNRLKKELLYATKKVNNDEKKYNAFIDSTYYSPYKPDYAPTTSQKIPPLHDISKTTGRDQYRRYEFFLKIVRFVPGHRSAVELVDRNGFRALLYPFDYNESQFTVGDCLQFTATISHIHEQTSTAVHIELRDMHLISNKGQPK